MSTMNQSQARMSKPGRNDPCSCGSGKKYKHCCAARAATLTDSSAAQSAAIALAIDQAKSLHQQGQLQQAQQVYESVLQSQPRQPDALHFLGVIAYQLKQFDVAEDLMKQSIAEDSSNAFYFSNLGMLYKDRGAVELAISCYRNAIQLKPDYPEAHLNLGVLLMELQHYVEAQHCFGQSLSFRPGYVEAIDNLGSAFMLQNEFARAIDCFRQALRLNDNYLFGYINLAAAHIYLKKYDVVVENSLKAISLDEHCASAYYYIGAACAERAEYEEAEQFLLHSISLDTTNSNVHFLLGTVNLARSNLADGWAGYEHRFSKKLDSVARRYYSYPWWMGESLQDKTVLVWAEQGIGDQIMYASMYADLVATARQCVFACAKKLIPLFSMSFPGAIVVDVEDQHILGSLNVPIDLQSAAGSIARWLRPTLASFPRDHHFLQVKPERVQHWKERLAQLGPELKVGISWRSGNMIGERAFYCSTIDQWAPILAVPGVQFINLQYDDCTTELARITAATGVPVHVFKDVDLFDDLAESAALMSALDLVISAPTTSGILSSACGVPTWVLMSGFDWQSFGTEENQWYSSQRIFNKSWEQGWEVLIDAIVSELHTRLADSNSAIATIK